MFDDEKLTKAMQVKAREFLARGCVFFDGVRHCFVVQHIPGYNSHDYAVTHSLRATNTGLECECQGWRYKYDHGELPICSHVIAVLLWAQSKGGLRVYLPVPSSTVVVSRS